MGLLGRRASVPLAAIVASLCVALYAAVPAHGGGFSELENQLDKIHGKVHTDGTLTVGQQETITVTRLPGKYRLQGFVDPPPTAQDCFQFNAGFCEAEPLFRVPGTRKFRSSKKGRAMLTFVTPPGYEFTNFKDPLQSHPVYFIDGQTVHVEVAVTLKRREGNSTYTLTGSVASAIARVEVPAPPPSG